MPNRLTVGVIAVVLGSSAGASLLWPKAAEAHDPVVHDPLEFMPTDPVRSPPLKEAS